MGARASIGFFVDGHGDALRAIWDAPTSSAYNHCLIVTGVGGALHGVSENSAAGLAAVDYDAYPHYLTTLEQAEPVTGTAFLVTWDPDRSIVSGADSIKSSSDAANVDRVVAMLQGMHDDPAGDDGTAWAVGAEVDAITLFLDDVDAAGHGNGFSAGIPAYIGEIESIDAQIGRILDAIEARPSFADEDWQVLITSDRGELGTGHGGQNPNSETIPFLVASRSVEQGLLPGRVLHRDAATTTIAHHLGAAGVPAHHEGIAQGATVRAAPPVDLDQDLVVHLPFDGDFLDVCGRDIPAFIGPNSDIDPILRASGGVCGGYLEISDAGGGPDLSSSLSLGQPRELVFARDRGFTIAAWFRADAAQSGDPVILGHEDWRSGLNAGTALLANEGGGNAFGINLSDGNLRRDVEPLEHALGEWWFVASSVDRQGSAVLFVGAPDGTWQLVSDFADDLVDLGTTLPWNIGQDRTGAYGDNLDGDIDELEIWLRALTLDEVRQLHAEFVDSCEPLLLRNAEILSLKPLTPLLSTILPLDETDDLYLRPALPGTVVPDAGGPLTFYTVTDAQTISVRKAAGAAVRVDF